MSGDSPPAWRAARLVWADEAPWLEWSNSQARTPRSSALRIGAGLAFVTGFQRRCIGVWGSGRRIGCPTDAAIDPGSRTGQCPGCAAMARSNSIATDTRPHDPRPFAVYLAHHGSAGIKVGITAVERGITRLLEQGALASVFLSTGTLASGRRAEHLLGTALGLPERITAARKRAARTCPPTAEQARSELLAVAGQTEQLHWPEGQSRRPPQVIDHIPGYQLPAEGLRPVAAVLPLAPGEQVTATVRCCIGSDLYLDTPSGTVLLDARLLTGWTLGRAEPGATFTARLQPLVQQPEVAQDALF